MNILHINSSDKGGGAAIACLRHCEAMRLAGIDAKMLVLNKTNGSPDFVYGIYPNNKIGKIKAILLIFISQFINRIFDIWGTFSFPIFSVSISKNILVKEADIIYIHWVGGSMLSTKEIEKILKLGKPVRWYMHDMNPITGGCHHALDCNQYQSECKKCPLQRRKTLGISLASIQYKKRLKLWNKYNNLEAFTPSRWLKECVEKSAIWKNHKVTEFPNVFNLKRFHSIDQKTCREILGLETSKKVILFGAVDIKDHYKGWEYLKDAINKLDYDKYEVVIFGKYNPIMKKELQLKCNFIGYLNDEYSLIIAYNAADVFVSSSLADNYPNVIMEAMACELPCVGFDIGGISNQIQHKQNGYLAKEKDSNDLANGIMYICDANEQQYSIMKKKAREFVQKVASYDVYNNLVFKD